MASHTEQKKKKYKNTKQLRCTHVMDMTSPMWNMKKTAKDSGIQLYLFGKNTWCENRIKSLEK